jgi:hypothetical protein
VGDHRGGLLSLSERRGERVGWLEITPTPLCAGERRPRDRGRSRLTPLRIWAHIRPDPFSSPPTSPLRGLRNRGLRTRSVLARRCGRQLAAARGTGHVGTGEPTRAGDVGPSHIRPARVRSPRGWARRHAACGEPGASWRSHSGARLAPRRAAQQTLYCKRGIPFLCTPGRSGLLEAPDAEFYPARRRPARSAIASIILSTAA